MELQLSVEQKQILSPQMQQSVKILQMNRMELNAFLQNAALENPLLDYESSGTLEYSKPDIVEKYLWLEECDKQNRIYYEQDYGNEREQQEAWRENGAEQESIAEYVLSQFMTETLKEKEREILVFLAHSLDEKGYFTDDIVQTADNLKVSVEEVSESLNLLKRAEPAGVGAKDLKECLLLQMDHKKLEAPIARELILEHLEILGKNQLASIAKKMKISMGVLLEHYKLIQELNPKPGNGFASRENLKYVKPDVTVVKFEDRFEILQNEPFSHISINSYYSQMLNEQLDEETKKYITEKLHQAVWVTQCIVQRGQTLSTVAKAIVESQQEFFQYGKGHLKPLILKNIGEKVSLHESTVSRAVKDKYLQCQWGIYPLSYFFSKSVGGQEQSGEQSATAVKEKIKELISREDKKKPYSDQMLSEKLGDMGIAISRRTVAKYRDACKIQDKSGRRRFET